MNSETQDLVEKIAIQIAEANNGGEWATHYKEEHKEFWRSKALGLIIEVRNSFCKTSCRKNTNFNKKFEVKNVG